jgi:hypothetical protein
MKAGMRFDPVLHGRGFVSGVLRGREVTRVPTATAGSS